MDNTLETYQMSENETSHNRPYFDVSQYSGRVWGEAPHPSRSRALIVPHAEPPHPHPNGEHEQAHDRR